MEQESRDRLIDRATELFSERGFHLIGVDEVIGASDELRFAMHRHFPRKEDLVHAVLEKRCDYILGGIGQRQKEIPDPVGKIKGVFDWHGEWFRAPGFAGCLLERALSEFGAEAKDISDVAIRFKDTLKKQMVDILRTLLPHTHAVRLAVVYAMLLHGASTAAHAHGDPEVARRAWQSAKVLLDEARCG